MRKSYHPFRRRAGSMAKWGPLAIFVVAALLYWPNKRRRIEGQMRTLADAISHQGPKVTGDWLKGLTDAVQGNCSRTNTAVTIEGVVNEALSQDQIIQAVTQIAADSTRVHVTLEHLTVDLSGQAERAQVNADATIEIAHDDRLDRERRHVFLSLEEDSGRYRLVSVETSAAIVNQPEPRP